MNQLSTLEAISSHKKTGYASDMIPMRNNALGYFLWKSFTLIVFEFQIHNKVYQRFHPSRKKSQLTLFGSSTMTKDQQQILARLFHKCFS